MSQKFMLYMITGNIMFLFLPMQTALMFMMMGIDLGGNNPSATTGWAAQSTTTAAPTLNTMLPLMLMSGGTGSKRRYRRNYSRGRTVVINRRYGGYRRY